MHKGLSHQHHCLLLVVVVVDEVVGVNNRNCGLEDLDRVGPFLALQLREALLLQLAVFV